MYQTYGAYVSDALHTSITCRSYSEKSLPVIKAGNYNYKDNKMPETNYYKQFNRENAQKLTAMLDELPDFLPGLFPQYFISHQRAYTP